MIMTKELEIIKKEFPTEGRKIPLEEIRSKTLQDYHQYMRDYPDSHYDNLTHEQLVQRLAELNEYKDDGLTEEKLRLKLKKLERTRHINIWHDNSCVANHGYLLCMVAILYDPAIYLTNEEYKTKTGKTVDVQDVVEKPHLHFLARCRSSEDEQIVYSETRLSCLQKTATPLKSPDGNIIKDVPRFFKGDSPARQFEDGQQEGGHFFCNCGCHALMIDDLAHTQGCPLYSIQERVDIVMKHGTVCRRKTLKGKTKPLAGLSRPDLEQELAARGIYDGKTKQDLQRLLEEMHAIQRLPALLVCKPKAPLNELHLENYEILPVEPIHDVGHHIENLLLELPHHLSTTEKQAMQESIASCMGTKETERGCDYRETLIKMTSYLQQKKLLTDKPMEALETLTELQRIIYTSDEARSPQLVLRYNNQAWYHAILLKQLIKADKMKKLTTRKMAGVYFHDLVAHGGDMLRIVSGRSANAEEEERNFKHHQDNYKENKQLQRVPACPKCVAESPSPSKEKEE